MVMVDQQTDERTLWTEQNILNWSLDKSGKLPLLVYGSLQFHPGLGWVRSPIGGYYPYTQFDYDASDRIIYIGINMATDAADDATDWIIFKFSYTGASTQPAKIQSKVGTYTDRATGW